MFTVVMLSLLIILNDSFASVFEKFNPGQTFWFRSLKWKWLSQQKIPPNKNFIPLKFLQAYHFNRLSKPLLRKVVRLMRLVPKCSKFYIKSVENTSEIFEYFPRKSSKVDFRSEKCVGDIKVRRRYRYHFERFSKLMLIINTNFR